jgi:hypothetical protein
MNGLGSALHSPDQIQSQFTRTNPYAQLETLRKEDKQYASDMQVRK